MATAYPEYAHFINILWTHFKKGRRRISTEPTVKEIEHDVHSILTHKKDGEIIVAGKAPKTIAGETKDERESGRTI